MPSSLGIWYTLELQGGALDVYAVPYHHVDLGICIAFCGPSAVSSLTLQNWLRLVNWILENHLCWPISDEASRYPVLGGSTLKSNGYA